VVDAVKGDPIGHEVVLERISSATTVMVRDIFSPNAQLQIEQIDSQKIIKNLLLLLILIFL